jgi:hypothetical protein
MKRFALLVFAAILLLALAGITFGNADQPSQQPPYTGVIQNKTKYDISFPSGNSDATLIVPARSSMEYQTWYPSFDLIGYVDGKPYYCQKINVNPKNYQFMCKNYDFMAEIFGKEKPVRKAKPIRQKRPKRKKPAGEEVEGLG